MNWLELVNMEYGECVVLGGQDRSILMVDCGSVSQKLRERDVPLDQWVETIAHRYDSAMDRYFLLTHYHRDHLPDSRNCWTAERVFQPGVPPQNSLGQPRRAPTARVCSVCLPVCPAPK